MVSGGKKTKTQTNKTIIFKLKTNISEFDHTSYNKTHLQVVMKKNGGLIIGHLPNKGLCFLIQKLVVEPYICNLSLIRLKSNKKIMFKNLVCHLRLSTLASFLSSRASTVETGPN